MIAKKWGFSRTRLDEYSAESHERAAAAQDGGAFTDQIVPVFVDGAENNVVAADEGCGAEAARRSSPRSSRPSPRTV